MKTIGLIFGGLSNEAEVSVMSARNIAKYFDHRRYRLALIYWNKQDRRFYRVKDITKIKPKKSDRVISEDFPKLFDVAFPITHGRYGEDGVLQAILESRGLPYCGCGVLSSALCMDKAMLKEMLSGSGIRQVRHAVLDYDVMGKDVEKDIDRVRKGFRLPVFVKPANSGSSVGITKVDDFRQLGKAIKEARHHDSKILIEEGLVNPTEVEVGVLGNGELIVSRPGELRLAKEFYDYDDKYKLGEAQTIVPARLPAGKVAEIRKLAEKVYRLAGCRGFARIDFFLAKGKVYLNEINTLPGFTDISMFPMVMMDRGMSYRELINKIIALAEK